MLAASTVVILNDPRQRGGLIAEAEQSGRSAEKSRAFVGLRFRLAHSLRALAIRIEPRVTAEAKAARVSQCSSSDWSQLMDMFPIIVAGRSTSAYLPSPAPTTAAT